MSVTLQKLAANLSLSLSILCGRSRVASLPILPGGGANVDTVEQVKVLGHLIKLGREQSVGRKSKIRTFGSKTPQCLVGAGRVALATRSILQCEFLDVIR